MLLDALRQALLAPSCEANIIPHDLKRGQDALHGRVGDLPRPPVRDAMLFLVPLILGIWPLFQPSAASLRSPNS